MPKRICNSQDSQDKEDVWEIKREYWIVIHEDLINIKRIRVVVDFISRVMKLEKNNLNI